VTTSLLVPMLDAVVALLFRGPDDDDDDDDDDDEARGRFLLLRTIRARGAVLELADTPKLLLPLLFWIVLLLLLLEEELLPPLCTSLNSKSWAVIGGSPRLR